jgi:hypothetical protein
VLTEAHAVSSELFIFSASFPLEAGVLLGGEHLVVVVCYQREFAAQQLLSNY